MFARAGVIGFFTKRQVNKKQSYLEKYHEKVKKEHLKELVYKSDPVMLWILGLMCSAVGGFLLFHILFYVPDTLFSGFKKGTWWQYLASFAVLGLGFAFLMQAERIKVLLNRKKDIISVTKTNLCLRRRVEERRASDCIKARIVKKGLDNVSSNTIHFNLMLDFEDDRPLKIAESNSRAQIKKKYVQVTDYLDLDIKIYDVPIEDETAKGIQREKKRKEREKEAEQELEKELQKEKESYNMKDNL